MRSPSHRVSSGRIWLTSAVGALGITISMAGVVSAGDETFSATNIITLKNGQKIQTFDISFIDPRIHRYVLADRTNQQIDVIDTSTNTLLTPLKAGFVGFTGSNDFSGPDGVVIVNHKEVWAGDAPCSAGEMHPDQCAPVTTSSSIKVIDLATGLQTHTILTNGVKRTDEMCVDTRDHIVLSANNADSPPFVSFISTDTYQVLKKIPFDGTSGTPNATNGIEQCQWSNRTGKFYISVPEIDGPGDNSAAGGVTVLDPKSMAVVQTFNLNHDECAGPQGMAMGPDKQILLGCNSPSGNGNFSTVIINEDSGATVQVLNNESGADEVWYSQSGGHYFLARGSAHGGIPYLGIVDAFRHSEDQSAATGVNEVRNAHSVASDGNNVYVPIPWGIGTICGQAAPPATDTQGCIAVFKPSVTQHSHSLRERAPNESQE